MGAPFLLVGKKILQDICKNRVDWDDNVSDTYYAKWEKWRKELLFLEEFQMLRCIKPQNFGIVKSHQLHHFSDASADGYGQVSYLGLENEQGEIHMSFLMGKSRVAPAKSVTIPCLELIAATISVKVRNMLVKELDYQQQKDVYWTNSTTVLQYINNETKRFPVFVANCVQTICESTNPSQWRYIESKNNPADDASRGLNGAQLLKQRRWIEGPSFLWKPIIEEPICPIVLKTIPCAAQDSDMCLANVVEESYSGDMLRQLLRFSDWHRLKKVVAWLSCARLTG